MQAWNIFPYLSWNGASWFVSVEFLLCLLFPLYLAVSRRGMAQRGAADRSSGASGSRCSRDIGYGLDLTYHNGI